MTAAEALAACAARVATLVEQHAAVHGCVKDLDQRVTELRATRAQAAADGQPVPGRAPLAALEAELADAQDLATELARRLQPAEEDHRRLAREALREEAAGKRKEAAKLQADLTEVTAEGDGLRRRAGALASRVMALSDEASTLEARANQR